MACRGSNRPKPNGGSPPAQSLSLRYCIVGGGVGGREQDRRPGGLPEAPFSFTAPVSPFIVFPPLSGALLAF